MPTVSNRNKRGSVFARQYFKGNTNLTTGPSGQPGDGTQWCVTAKRRLTTHRTGRGGAGWGGVEEVLTITMSLLTSDGRDGITGDKEWRHIMGGAFQKSW